MGFCRTGANANSRFSDLQKSPQLGYKVQYRGSDWPHDFPARIVHWQPKRYQLFKTWASIGEPWPDQGSQFVDCPITLPRRLIVFDHSDMTIGIARLLDFADWLEVNRSIKNLQILVNSVRKRTVHKSPHGPPVNHESLFNFERLDSMNEYRLEAGNMDFTIY
jgi:hypothetical protein